MSRPTLAFVAIFVALAASVWYFELREGAVTPTPNQAAIFDLNPVDVTRIEVVDSGRTTAVERLEEERWRLVAPEAGEADNRRALDLVGRLAQLGSIRKLEAANDLAAYGLAAPTSTVEMRTKDGGTYRLEIGAKTPDGANFYVKRADNPTVYVAGSFTIQDALRWAADPPRPRPTPTPTIAAIGTPKP